MAEEILSLISNGLISTSKVCATCTPSPTVISSSITQAVTPTSGSGSSISRNPTFITSTQSPSVISSSSIKTVTPTSGGGSSISRNPTFVTPPSVITQTVIITNPTSTSAPESHGVDSAKLKIILGVVIPLGCIFLVACLWCFISKRRKSAGESRSHELATVRSISEMPEVKTSDGRQIIPPGYVRESAKKSSGLASTGPYSTTISPSGLDSNWYRASGSTSSANRREAMHQSSSPHPVLRAIIEDEEDSIDGIQAYPFSAAYFPFTNPQLARSEEAQGASSIAELKPAPLNIVKKNPVDASPSGRTPRRTSSHPDISPVGGLIPPPAVYDPLQERPVMQANARDSDVPTDEERQMWYERTLARLERPATMLRYPGRTSSIYSRDEYGVPYDHLNILAAMGTENPNGDSGVGARGNWS